MKDIKQNFKIKLLTSVLALEIILLNLEHVPLNNVYAKKISNGTEPHNAFSRIQNFIHILHNPIR